MATHAELGKLMSRNVPVGTAIGFLDNYRRWLISKGAVASSGRSVRALEKSFFAANGGSGKTYTELKGSFLAAKGFTGGRSLEENWRRFLSSGTV